MPDRVCGTAHHRGDLLRRHPSEVMHLDEAAERRTAIGEIVSRGGEHLDTRFVHEGRRLQRVAPPLVPPRPGRGTSHDPYRYFHGVALNVWREHAGELTESGVWKPRPSRRLSSSAGTVDFRPS